MKILSRYMNWQVQNTAVSNKGTKGKLFAVANDTFHATTEERGLSDDEILHLLFSASNGRDNIKLFNGDTSNHNNDHSAADLAFVNNIAFYTQDPEQVDRIFRQSELMRDKWDEMHSSTTGETYGEMTINKALEDLNDTYTPPKKPDSQPKFKLTPIAEIMARSFETEYLIKSLLPADSTAMVFGPPVSCKSLIAMEMAFCIGAGLDYYGNPVKQGNVIYIAGEGHKGIKKRFKALAIKYGLEPVNVHVSEISMDLNSESNVTTVEGAISRIPDVKLIIVDTLHRNFTGDENGAKDFATVMKHCDRLRNATGASIMLVHHSGHDSKGRGRGSSAMTAAMDVEYKVSKSDKKVTLNCTKMKDDETPKDIIFDLNSVTIGQDEDGKAITAPILKKSTTFFTAEKPATLNEIDKLTLDILVQLSCENRSPVSKAEWRDACMEKYSVSSDPEKAHEAKRRKFDRCLKSLLDKGFVVEDNGCFTVTDPDATTEGDE